MTLAVTVAALTLTACGGGQNAPGASSTSVSAASPCAGNDLGVSQANMALYTGHDLYVYALKNTSESACTLVGYPQLIGFAASGSNLHAKFDDTTDSPLYQGASAETVTLQPGSSAGLYVGSVSDPGMTDECNAAARAHGTVQVTVSGGGPPLTIPSNTCPSQTIYVSPYQPSPALPQPPSASQ